jgi:hypothetical protein
MAEPTTIANMFEEGFVEWKRGNKKALGRNLASIVASSFINALAVSFVYAARDDDDDEYWDKYLKKFVDNFGSNIVPVNWYPILKDLMSLIEGYEIERTDMSIVSDFVKAIKSLSSTKASMWDKVENFVGAVSSLFGLPVKNIMRDLKAIWNTFFK